MPLLTEGHLFFLSLSAKLPSMHPYKSYIETKADDYFSRQAHETLCNTLQPYQVPVNSRTGETYDVYFVPICNCWLSEGYDKLTLERKLEALRDLSRSFHLHSPACSYLKRTPITYRNKPEFLTYGCDCWLSVDPRPEHSCPLCAKPLFYAPRAPQDTTKQACSDPECINAHGLVDFGLPSPVEYNKDQEQRKDHTMGDLHIAKHRAETAEQAQLDINNFLAPFVDKFKELSIDLNSRGMDLRDFTADRFVQIEGSSFYLTGDEIYEYGETYVPHLNLPFDFVEDPEAYRQKAISEEATRQEKAAAKKKKDAEELVERLKAHLAKAEADVRAADAQKDAIKSLANRNTAKNLRTELAKGTDKG